MRILFLSSWFPYPADNGSKLRIYNLLKGLADKHDVTLLSFYTPDCADTNPPELRSLCKDVVAVPWQPPRQARLTSWLDYFSATPRWIKATRSPEMASQIRKIISSQGIDLVIASQLTAATYIDSFGGVPALFEEVEIGVLYEQYTQSPAGWHRFRNGLTWLKHRRYLQSVLSKFRACTVVSEQERKLLAKTTNFNPIEVIPNCIDLADYEKVSCNPQPLTMIFTGSFRYSANHDAMVWFIQEVLPLIQADIPDLRLIITGDPCGKALPGAENVLQTGYVEDVRPLVASSWISLAPLRNGGGTRLKILEAMALGTPVVATTKGAEGLSVQPGKHLLIADEPKQMAGAISGLLKDKEQRQTIAACARQLLAEQYDWEVIMPRFLQLLKDIEQSQTLGIYKGT